MIQDIFAFIQQNISMGQTVALVTVTETYGSSPASAGQLMAVLADGSAKGTVGGGATEYKIIQSAREAINRGDSVFQFDYDHTENGMVCGGGMRGFGNILGNENHLYIFGAGHVAQSLAPIAEATGFFVTVIDDRKELSAAFPSTKFIACKAEAYKEQIQFSNSAYIVICTRGHNTDDEALRFSLSGSPKYIGMIGSAKKVASIFDRLRVAGYANEKLSTVYTPIGLDIASGIPAEIAVSIMAEILLIKNHGSLRHKKTSG